MKEKDWIIARLLYALYAEGRNANTPDAMKAVNWFTQKHSHDQLLDAFSKVCGEGKTYEPYWKNKGEWS